MQRTKNNSREFKIILKKFTRVLKIQNTLREFKKFMRIKKMQGYSKEFREFKLLKRMLIIQC